MFTMEGGGENQTYHSKVNSSYHGVNHHFKNNLKLCILKRDDVCRKSIIHGQKKPNNTKA